MSASYAVMYMHYELIQKRSRVQGGVVYMQRFQDAKIERITKLVTFIYVGFYISAQTALLVLTVLDFMEINTFVAQLSAFTLLLIAALNVNATVMYCRNAGSPYKTPKI